MKKAERERFEALIRQFVKPDIGLSFFREGLLKMYVYGVHKDDINDIQKIMDIRGSNGNLHMYLHCSSDRFIAWFNPELLDALELLGVHTHKEYFLSYCYKGGA